MTKSADPVSVTGGCVVDVVGRSDAAELGVRVVAPPGAVVLPQAASSSTAPLAITAWAASWSVPADIDRLVPSIACSVGI
jgi:hypothetical protein